MEKYKIAAVIWVDHARFTNTKMVSNPDEAITPTLTVGVVYKETDNTCVLASDFERYEDRDDVTYTIIQKPAIIARTDYGEIELEKMRE